MRNEGAPEAHVALLAHVVRLRFASTCNGYETTDDRQARQQTGKLNPELSLPGFAHSACDALCSIMELCNPVSRRRPASPQY